MTKILSLTCLLSVAFLGVLSPAAAQETDSQVRVVVTEGVRARVAVADFQQRGSEMTLEGHARLFNDILWNDLRRAGVFELVPKSFYPLQLPSQPYEVNYEEWAAEDVRAQNLVYGNSYLQRGQFVVEARLIDVNTRESIIGNRYRVDPEEEGVRSLAHRFADEIVLRIGGGVRGIASTRIAFVSDRNGHKEIYTMDYDGYGQTALTNHRSISLTPRWSLDNSRIAYTSYHRGNPDLYFAPSTIRGSFPFPSRRVDHHSGLCSRRRKDRLQLQQEPRSRNLRFRSPWPPSQAADPGSRRGHLARMESQDGKANRLCLRTQRFPPDLDHG